MTEIMEAQIKAQARQIAAEAWRRAENTIEAQLRQAVEEARRRIDEPRWGSK